MIERQNECKAISAKTKQAWGVKIALSEPEQSNNGRLSRMIVSVFKPWSVSMIF